MTIKNKKIPNIFQKHENMYIKYGKKVKII